MHDDTDAYHKMSPPPATRPNGCPFNTTFTPFDSDYLQNPYAQLTALQQDTPMFYAESLGYLVVTRMDHVVEILKNHELFSSANVQDPVFPLCDAARAVLDVPDYNPQAVMSNCQQPDHTRIRKFTRDGFNARRMTVLSPYIRETAEQLITQMRSCDAPADFVSAFAHPLPGRVIFRFIGFPEEDYNDLVAWTANRLLFTWGQPTEAQQVEIAGNMLTYWRYCRAFVAQRQEQPDDDFTSELLAAHSADPDGLSYREVESIVYGLSFAGHEIVSNFLSLALLCTLGDRQHWHRMCSQPDSIAQTLEEVLRFESPQTSWRRVATRDTNFHGVDIPSGTRIFLSLGAANYDPATFDEPNRFDPARENANRNVSFGHGIHFCLGARLARLEAQIAFESLCARAPDLRLVQEQALSFAPNITFRGPQQLLVAWDQ